MIAPSEKKYLEMAIQLSLDGIESGKGGPFGCVIVLNDEIVGEGCNMVTSQNDPTAHAEVVAIRNACQKLGTHQLDGCIIYTSCEPCPMCLGAIYWARPSRVVYANTKEDAASIAFDDDFIYEEINAPMEKRKIPFIHQPHPSAKEVFDKWSKMENKKKY